MTAQALFDAVSRKVSGIWSGSGPSFGHLFLALAVWNTFVAAFNITVWPRVYDLQTLAYMKPVNEVLPILLCLWMASFSKSIGLRSISKTVIAMGAIALITFAFWGHQSEAWLNQYGYHILH